MDTDSDNCQTYLLVIGGTDALFVGEAPIILKALSMVATGTIFNALGMASQKLEPATSRSQSGRFSS